MNRRLYVIRVGEPVLCGAKCRDGHACKRRPVMGKMRCANHGGKSTGPKTAEGREAISAANRRRWENWRKKKVRQGIIERGKAGIRAKMEAIWAEQQAGN